MDYARDLAKAERELEIEHWEYISFEYRNDRNEGVRLYHYDMPRRLHDKYRWLIRYRAALLQVQHPFRHIQTFYSYYDKRTGLRTDHDSCLKKLASAKAQLTKAKRCERAHIDAMKERYPLFYDESTDAELIKYRIKIVQKEENIRKLAEHIRKAVEEHRKLVRMPALAPVNDSSVYTAVS